MYWIEIVLETFRTGGDISKIAKDLDLGHPVAGNFFLAEKKALTGDYQLEIAEKREALEEDIKKQELEVEMKKQALEEEIKKQALMEEDMRNQTQQEEMKGQAIGEAKKKKWRQLSNTQQWIQPDQNIICMK